MLLRTTTTTEQQKPVWDAPQGLWRAEEPGKAVQAGQALEGTARAAAGRLCLPSSRAGKSRITIGLTDRPKPALVWSCRQQDVGWISDFLRKT